MAMRLVKSLKKNLKRKKLKLNKIRLDKKSLNKTHFSNKIVTILVIKVVITSESKTKTRP